MREMKNSGIEWIGEIPSHWKISAIKNYCINVFAGGTPQSNNVKYWDGDIPWIPSGSCHDCKIINAPKFITKMGFENSSTKMIPANTAVVAMTGATCGNTGYLTFDSCANQSVTAYVAKDSTYSLFIWYLIQAAKEHLLTFQTGGAQGGVNVDNCKRIVVPYISYNEQKRIADFLDDKCEKIDDIIEKQKQVIEKLKEYKLSVITEAVTKGLDPTVSMKDSGVEWIGEIPETWQIKKLKYATTIMRGRFNHRPRNDPDYYDGQYPFVQTGDVARATKYISNYSQTLNDLGYSVSKEFPCGSIVMTIAANVADVAILNFNACFPDSVVGFVPKNIEPMYLYYVLKAMKQQLLRNAIISTQLNLNIEIIKEELIPIPSKDEQHRILNALEKMITSIDSYIAKKQAIIDKLIEYEHSLIYEVVTGKKEV